jgi:hypothetical protein
VFGDAGETATVEIGSETDDSVTGDRYVAAQSAVAQRHHSGLVPTYTVFAGGKS